MKGAVEQAQYGVRANCVSPGPIDTAWTHKETGAVDAEIEKALITATPLGRRGTLRRWLTCTRFSPLTPPVLSPAPCG